MEHLKEISQKPQMHLSGADFSLKNVREGFFKYFLLKCTMNRDVFKRTFMIGAFIQHLTHFWFRFLGLFLGRGVQNCTPGHYF